ncbi:unnamed protein product [Prorocentrum cordatum]|uniref:N-alpha-acetyltransferase 15, NatA auxiliary subunit n=1 Tax=Prorocentrum cordatum TaxID=2364126 RepID=A0ABN9TLM8_9DINO|nr:unnamed protein product [Polarella glacialis]
MQQLPAKDQAVFRSIVKFYETKQYKKGVKAADSILKKHPDHGETLCMKGLTLSYLDRKEEAYELVRKGLKFDLKSHICWHVFGLLYRQDRDYFEAVRCYKQALRIDPENIQILRDLSLLQIHRRDLPGFAETRRKLLQVKPGNRLNWVGYAIAEHLCKSYEFAWTCIDNYEKTFKDDSVADYENSELYMYKATIMEEAGKLEEALDMLKKCESSIVDKLGLLEMKAVGKGRYQEASDIYRELIGMNPEHHHYIQGPAVRLGQPLASPRFLHHALPSSSLDLAMHSLPFNPAAPPAATPAMHPSATTPPHAQHQRPSPKGRSAAPGRRGRSGVRASPAQPPGSDASRRGADVPSTMASFPQSMHPEGLPIWGWLPPQHALKAQKRVTIGKRQHKRRLESYEPQVPLTEEEEEAVSGFFDDLQKEFPKSDSLKRLPLYFVTGARFQKRLDGYLRSKLRRGVPSLFRMVRPLYFQPGKPALIEELLQQYLRCLEEEVPWFGPPVGEAGTSDHDEEPPSCLLFTLMVAAEHFDFLGDTPKALEYADKAIEHTPTLVEIYACKAKIYRHAGNLEESARLFDEVRQMDLADRFLNTQCVRAFLRTDDTQQGMEKALLFSKEPDSPEAANLHDMQCMWYESFVGRSYTRQGKPGRALKKFNETFKHFSDIAEDQFDFHNYCLRKTTLRSYVAMLRMQERLYSHKFYRAAAKDAIKIYVDLFDRKERGEVLTSKDEADGKEAEMTAAERKKMKHQKKRQEKKEDPPASKDGKTTASGKPKKVDDDPEGEKLLEKDPMEEASKLVKTLVLYCDADAATHTLTYEVARRQGKLLHCLQALLRLWKLAGGDRTDYKLAEPLLHFCFKAGLDDPSVSSVVREVVLSEVAPLVGKDGPLGGVEALRAAAGEVADALEKRIKAEAGLPLIEVLYSLRALKNAGRDTKPLLEQWRPEGAFALKECTKMLSYLGGEFGKDSTAYEKFKQRCLDLFPLMVIR